MIKTVLTWIAGFFGDSARTSSTRLVMIGGVYIPLTVWAGLSVYHRALQDFPAGVIAVMVLCVTGKAAQQYFETRPAVVTKTVIPQQPTPVEVNVNPSS